MARHDYHPALRLALARAREEALELRHDYVGTEHLLLGLLRSDSPDLRAVLRRVGLDAERIADVLRGSIRPGRAPVAPTDLPFTALAKDALQGALREARRSGLGRVEPVHLLVGILECRDGGGRAARDAGIDPAEIREACVAHARGEPEPAEEPPVWVLTLDPGSDAPIYEQIIDRIEEAVATTRLLPGERLPSVRDLASELGIAPGTVSRAYSTLEERGVLVTEGARGTRVAESAGSPPADDLEETLEGLLRPVAVAAYHLGARAGQLRTALEGAMRGIYAERPGC